MKRDFKKDIENGMYKNEDAIASLIPYLLHDTVYALPLNATPNLRKHIAAAIFKYNNQDSDYEDILNQIDVTKYSDKNSYSPHDMVIHTVVEQAVTTSKVLNNYNIWCLKEKTKLNEELFFASMLRIVSSFQSAAILLRHGFYVEVVSIFRMILEQLAWGCYLIQETDESKIYKNHTQSNVKYLKKVLGDDFGTLYGYLSSEAHLEPKEIGKYIRPDKNGIYIKGRSGKHCKEETGTLLLILKAYSRVIWFAIKQFGIPDEFINYYKDWNNLNEYTINILYKYLYEKVKLKRDNIDYMTINE